LDGIVGGRDHSVARVGFGLAVRNFTPYTATPEIREVLDYAGRAERLGFSSLWAWDHILLGSKTPFPFLESLSVLAALAVTTDKVRLGTGVLVLPLRNPVVLAKVTSTIDRMSDGRLVLGVASGWYEREFESVGVPFTERGRVFERNAEILKRFWTEERVSGSEDGMVFRSVVMLPRPVQQPRPQLLFGGYVDKVLRRVATMSDGWLTYFYPPESFTRAWRKILRFAEEAGRDPATLDNVTQLPICIDSSFEKADARVRAFIDDYFDVAPWSESTADSAIRGTPEQCAEQIARHVEVGARHIVFVPCSYDHEQIDAIAESVLPRFADGSGEVP
jgi:probable F420-dependent oxidoreductase